mmetsp:Transcript_19754/g.42470  ORF Transcript_19754/g.42470 Transcript_19754/m.42470 type:complete len:278 (+) Transcript_19754:74-907(+)
MSRATLPPSFLYGALFGCTTYLLFRALSPVLLKLFGSQTMQQHVAQLSPGKQYHFHSQLPSTFHALVQIVGTFNVVFYGRQGFDDVLKEGTSPSIVFDDRTFVSYGITHLGPAVYMGFFVGYLLADTAKSPSFKDMGYVYVVHHAAASLCWTFCTCYRVMQPLSCFLQFNELSTPFMNVRQVMLTAGYKSSDLLVTIISLLFFFTFGAVRFFPLPFIIRNWVGRDYSAIQNEVGTGAAMMLSVFVAVHVFLQSSWFLQMCHKLIGMFRKGTKSTKSE